MVRWIRPPRDPHHGRLFWRTYNVKLEVKGGYVDRNCSKLIVTTNIHPRNWYDYENREEHYLALARRFNKVIVFCRDHTDRTSRIITEGAYEQVNKDNFFHHWIGYGETSNLDTSRPISLPWMQDEPAMPETPEQSILLVPDTQPEDARERRVNRVTHRTERIVIPDTEESDSGSDSEISVD